MLEAFLDLLWGENSEKGIIGSLILIVHYGYIWPEGSQGRNSLQANQQWTVVITTSEVLKLVLPWVMFAV